MSSAAGAGRVHLNALTPTSPSRSRHLLGQARATSPSCRSPTSSSATPGARPRYCWARGSARCRRHRLRPAGHRLRLGTIAAPNLPLAMLAFAIAGIGNGSSSSRSVAGSTTIPDARTAAPSRRAARSGRGRQGRVVEPPRIGLTSCNFLPGRDAGGHRPFSPLWGSQGAPRRGADGRRRPSVRPDRPQRRGQDDAVQLPEPPR